MDRAGLVVVPIHAVYFVAFVNHHGVVPAARCYALDAFKVPEPERGEVVAFALSLEPEITEVSSSGGVSHFVSG